MNLRKTRLSADELTGRKGEFYGYNVQIIKEKVVESSFPYLYDIAAGNVSGKASKHISGYNGDIDAALELVWNVGGAYPYLAAAEKLQIYSGSGNDDGSVLSSGTATAGSTTAGSTTTLEDDTADFNVDGGAAGDAVLDDTNVAMGIVLSVDVGGTIITLVSAMDTAFAAGTVYRVVNANSTGAAVVRLDGMDDDYALLSEYIVMNGVADVETLGDFYRIFKTTVVHAASGGVNIGQIDVENNASAIVMCRIAAGANESQSCMWTVPASKVFYVCKYNLNEIANIRVSGAVYKRQPGGTVFEAMGETIAAKANSSQEKHLLPEPVSAGYDIEFRAITSAAAPNAEVFADFEGWYENE